MKIGIISFWDSQSNYGQVLQCFAMQQLFKSLGHEPTHIKYRYAERTKPEKLRLLFQAAFSGHLYSFLKLFVENRRAVNENPASGYAVQADRKFDDFRERNILFTDSEYSRSSLRSKPPRFDAYVCGSDQIWGVPSEEFMLQFAPKDAKCLSYAASMGGLKFTNKYQQFLLKKYLKRFDYISVREQDGLDVLTNLGIKNAKVVLDPTFMIPVETYRKLAVKPEDEDYIFLYLLGNKTDIDVNRIFEWAASKNLKVVYALSQGRAGSITNVTPTVNEWLGLIDNAKYVITNSFHGMALSMKFQKQFMAVPLSGSYARMNSRIYGILDKFNLRDRCFDGSLDKLTAPIDYDRVEQIISAERDRTVSEIRSILTP